MTVNNTKRDVTIYQKSYQVPTISSVILEKLQQQIEHHGDRLIRGKQIVQQKEQRSFLRTKIIEETIQQPLTFQESSDELTMIQRDYNSVLAILKSYKYDYQCFVQRLITEVQEIIEINVISIIEREEKRQLNEQQEFDKADPNDHILTLLVMLEKELLKITKMTIYACILMVKKVDEITQNLTKIGFEQSPFLLEALGELNKYKEFYQLTAEMKSIRPHSSSSKNKNINLNLGKSVKSLIATLKIRLATITQIDREISRAIGEINNIAHCLESQQLNKLEPDLESQEMTELFVTKNFNPDRFQQQLQRGKPFQVQSWFDNTFEQEQQRIINIDLVIKVLLERGLQRLALTALSQYLTPLPPLNTILVELCLHNLQTFTTLKFNYLKQLNQPTETPLEATIVIEEVGQSEVFVEYLPNGAVLEMVKMEAGTFLMGSSSGASTEKPQHSVELSAFYLGKYPITQEQYQAVMGSNPAKYKNNGKNPVENVSWNDSQAFCKKLSQMTGKNYQLASEAQWEYGCAAGTQTKYYFGDDEHQLADYAWYGDNSRSTTHPVGLKKPNPWGLYDMYGNVWEWCEDTWHPHYGGAPIDGSSWKDKRYPQQHVLRGGSWHSNPSFCRSSSRYTQEEDQKNSRYGFRVVLTLGE